MHIILSVTRVHIMSLLCVFRTETPNFTQFPAVFIRAKASWASLCPCLLALFLFRSRLAAMLVRFYRYSF